MFDLQMIPAVALVGLLTTSTVVVGASIGLYVPLAKGVLASAMGLPRGC